MVLGILGGLWLDNKFDQSFYWLIGLLLGIFVAFWGVYRMLLPLLKDNDRRDS